VARVVVTEQLRTDPSITVIAAVADPNVAMALIKKHLPDVIVMELAFPRMDGLTFLRKIMAERPTPVVICATLTDAGSLTVPELLAAGAVRVVNKAKDGLQQFLGDTTADLIDAVKAAATLPSSAAARPRDDPQVPLAAKPTTERVVAAPQKTIRVLVVDHSAVARVIVSEQLRTDPSITVTAAVADPIFAMLSMKKQWPDVIVMELDLPRMDGLTFLRKIMAERPTPVVICSTLTAHGAPTTSELLAAGAIRVVNKPKGGMKQFFEDATADLIGAVKAASQAELGTVKAATLPSSGASRLRADPLVASAKVLTADVITAAPTPQAANPTTERIVALGTSMGGTQALERVLLALPSDCPGIAIVQHMPEQFMKAFAERLNDVSEIEVREAEHGEQLLPGHALIAPGGKHLMLKRRGRQYFAEVIDGPFVNRHRPSVDVLFRSIAKCAGSNALGIIMTGMGDDGAHGLLEMRQAGAATVAQDEASCVVFGMPKAAIELSAAERVMSLGHIAQAIMTWGADRGAPKP